MNFFHYKRPSTYLILLASILLSLGSLMAYFVYNAVDDIEHDAGHINKTGVIRGSIQRVTKLVLYDSIQSSDVIIKDINRLIEQFLAMEKDDAFNSSNKDVLNSLKILKTKWQKLEYWIAHYRETHSEQSRKEIIEESESCWKAADAVVLAAQLSSESKVAGFQLFYIILLLNAITAILVILLVFIYVRKKLEFESLHDPLTHAHNRRSYESIIDTELARSARYNHPLSLILLDIDHFKGINDKYGHKAGDSVLIELVQVLIKTARKTDRIFRVGGEEFAIIIPETNIAGASDLAEKVRAIVSNYPFKTVNKVTVSIGVAEFHPDITKDELYNNADQAMYFAKDAGRNRSEIFVNSNMESPHNSIS